MKEIKRKDSEDGTELTSSEAELPLFASIQDKKEAEAKQKKATSIVIMFLVVLTVVLMFAVNAGVKMNELSLEVSKLKGDIETLEKKKRENEFELEKKNDMVAFEDYAINQLGMLKGNESQDDSREDEIK